MPEKTIQLLRKAEAARRLDVSPSTLDRLRAKGEIAWVPVGGSVRFTPEALAAYVERAERPARAEERPPERRARARPSVPPPGPRRRRQSAQGLDELFPISMPERQPSAGGAR